MTITGENGQTLVETNESDELSPNMEMMLLSKKRVRIPSSILSELYPKLPNPYYRLITTILKLLFHFRPLENKSCRYV